MTSHYPRATIDFETRSQCSISACGSWKYSLDPSTEILCLAFRLPHWEAGRTALWHPPFAHLRLPESDTPELSELFTWIEAGHPVEAHNVFFECGIWANTAPQSWPKIALSQWRCSAAKAAAHALPRALDDAIEALDLPIQKDADGAALMKEMSSPHTPLKDEREEWALRHAACKVCVGSGKVAGINPATGRAKQMPCIRCEGKGWKGKVPPMPVMWRESKADMRRLWQYCRMDVLAEEGLSQALPDLTPLEQIIFTLDLEINTRGFYIDRDAVDAALVLVDAAADDLNAELRHITNGVVSKATQRKQMMEWLATEGLDLPDTQAATIDGVLEHRSLSTKVRRALELMRSLGRSSTAKYVKMREWMCPDNRLRGGLLYHGATTGRWTGKGVQPHNFPKEVLKGVKQEDLWDVLLTKDVAKVKATYDDVLMALSHGLRGAITATPGNQLYVSDFSGIEARVVMWLARDEKALDVFRSGQDIYCYMAEDIVKHPVTPKDKQDRALGKVAVLGLGYQMGAAKFTETCAKWGITIPEDQECEECGKGENNHFRADHPYAPANPDLITGVRIVRAFRNKFSLLTQMWKDTEDDAIQAVMRQGAVISSGRVTWQCEDYFLYCTLPSGRRLAYPDPYVRQIETPWGAKRNQLSFMGVDIYTRQWKRQTTYGGMLVENITQAVARDLMAEALLSCSYSEIYSPVLSVHDELIAEAPLLVGDVHEFEQMMSRCPSWAIGLPIASEGWRGVRYRK